MGGVEGEGGKKGLRVTCPFLIIRDGASQCVKELLMLLILLMNIHE